jgi:hypothetical protein
MLWKLAAERFATEPYSNGRDARYEQVKAELRSRWGHDVIHSRNKVRLKQLALNRGAEEEHEEEEEEEEEKKEEISRTKRGSSAMSEDNIDEEDGEDADAESDRIMKNILLLPRFTVSTLALRGLLVDQAMKTSKKNGLQGRPSSFMLHVTIVPSKNEEQREEKGVDESISASANLVDGNERTLCGVWTKKSTKRSQVLVFAGQASWTLGGHFHGMNLRVDIVERKAKNILNAITGIFSLSLSFFLSFSRRYKRTHVSLFLTFFLVTLHTYILGTERILASALFPLGMFAGTCNERVAWFRVGRDASVKMRVRLDNAGLEYAVDRILQTSASPSTFLGDIERHRNKLVTQRLNAGEVLAWRFDMSIGSGRLSSSPGSNNNIEKKPCVDFRVSVNGHRCTLTEHEIEDVDILVPQVSNSGIIRALRDDTEVVLTWKPSSSENVTSAMSNRSTSLLMKKRNKCMKQLNFSVAKVTRRGFRRVIRKVRQNYLAQRPFVGCSHVSMESMFQTTRMRSKDDDDEMNSQFAVGAYRFRKGRLDERRETTRGENTSLEISSSSSSSMKNSGHDESVITTAMTLNGYIHPVSIVRSVLGRSRGRHHWHFKVIDVGVGGVSVGISGALVSLDRPLGMWYFFLSLSRYWSAKRENIVFSISHSLTLSVSFSLSHTHTHTHIYSPP